MRVRSVGRDLGAEADRRARVGGGQILRLQPVNRRRAGRGGGEHINLIARPIRDIDIALRVHGDARPACQMSFAETRISEPLGSNAPTRLPL